MVQWLVASLNNQADLLLLGNPNLSNSFYLPVCISNSVLSLTKTPRVKRSENDLDVSAKRKSSRTRSMSSQKTTWKASAESDMN